MEFFIGVLFSFWRVLRCVIFDILVGRFVLKGGGEVIPVGFVEIPVVLTRFEDDSSDGFSVVFDRRFELLRDLVERVFLKSFTISAVRIFKKPWAIDPRIVIFCSKFYLMEIVL